ncbi:sugar kinase [Rubrivirga marina]|uniref:2-dehydro-3-deoxygluconokinase n=1 Tax=Rubrivirga marina TaxID=1196024 RepID=A0A271IW16_9BACT|nr:sugar kinase [Rubrivirga marina]PAP75392.1 2-dehydro-3-deoxygluconokinase [Rubrivirga marina]
MKVVTLGEIMLRLSTPGFTRFVQAQSFDATYGGGEANVAVALANYGFESYFVSKLPAHEIGQAAVNHLRRFGVSDRFIVRGGDRVGIYFLETGASQRPSKVIYDRTDAAVTTLTPDELDLGAVFEGARWFHFTGITPALGETARKTVVAAAKAAKGAGATVSCDLNFRKKLWTTEEAQATMRPLMEHVDVCIANEEDADKCLGLTAGETDVHGAELDEAGYVDLAKRLKREFDFEAVAITLRESFSASHNGWSAILHDDKDCAEPVRSTRYDIQIVDRVGGGDSFASGLIAGLLQKGDTREALEFAVAASCLKQTIPGDFNLVSRAEVDALVAGDGSGRVQR